MGHGSLNNHSICHGDLGNALIVEYAARKMDRENWIRWSDLQVNRVLSQLENEHLNGEGQPKIAARAKQRHVGDRSYLGTRPRQWHQACQGRSAMQRNRRRVHQR